MQRSSEVISELDNPYIRKLNNLNEILPEDTIIVREVEANGHLKNPHRDGKVIRIRDLKTLDTYKNLVK